MSTPNSLTILSPHFLLGNHMFILSLWVCFVNKFICVISFQIPQKAESSHFSFFVWLTAFSMPVSRPSHVATNGVTSFFLWLTFHHVSFLHSSVDGHSGCFHTLASVNSAAVNVGGACVYFPLRFIVVMVAFIFFLAI